MYRSLSPKQLSPYMHEDLDRKDYFLKELTLEINALQSFDFNFIALNDQIV
jgi:hypothetical protein